MLKINNLKKEYKDFTLDCSLSVRKGSITGLIGANGAGKSTTFKSIMGLIFPDSGSIEVFGKNIKDLDVKDRQRFGVVLSNSGFSGYSTIKDIVPVLEAMYDKFDKARFLKMCEDFNLPLKKCLKEFSTGMSVKFKCVVAMTHGADLLILDEPTAGLDVIAREEILDMLRGYIEEDEQRSILISSHISSDLEGLCDDIFLIDNGNIMLHEDTDVLLNEYALLKLSNEEFESIDKNYILRYRKEKFGVCALTKERNFYIENYPRIVVEKGGIDELIIMMVKGETL